MWDLIVSVPDHCLSFYFTNVSFYYTFHHLRVFHQYVRIILNHKKLACEIFHLHILACQRILPIFNVSIRMFRQFVLISTLYSR